MKNGLLIATFGVLASLPGVLAVEEHHADRQAQAKQHVSPPPQDENKSVQRMQENVKKMQSQFDHVANSKDSKEHRKLLQKHMQTMQDNTAMSKSMIDCPMISGGMA